MSTDRYARCATCLGTRGHHSDTCQEERGGYPAGSWRQPTVIAPGAFGPDPVTVPLRIDLQGDPIGTATVRQDDNGLRFECRIDDERLRRLIEDALGRRPRPLPAIVCGRVLVGQGDDTSDPICQLPAGHWHCPGGVDPRDVCLCRPARTHDDAND